MVGGQSQKSFAPSASPEEQRLLEQITRRFSKQKEDGDEADCVEVVQRVCMPWRRMFKLQDSNSLFEFKFVYQSLGQELTKFDKVLTTAYIDLAYYYIIAFGIFQLVSISTFDEASGQTMNTAPFIMMFIASASIMNVMSLPDCLPKAAVHGSMAFVLISLYALIVILLSLNFLNLGIMKSSLILTIYLSRILRFRMALLFSIVASILFLYYSTAFHRALDAQKAFHYSSSLIVDLVELLLCNMVGLYACIVSIVRTNNTFGTLVENFALIKKNEEEGSIRKEWVRKVMPKIVVEPYEKFKFNQSLLRKNNTGLIVPYHEEYIFASMLFADIVNFTMMSAGRSASEVVHILNRIYGAFDISASRLQIEKIGTLGDCYYCVSGVPMTEKKRLSTVQAFASKESQRNQVYYVLCSVAMGLEMCEKIQAFNDSMGLPDEQRVDMRIGVHWGSLNAVILGASRYKFDIYSDDSLMANEMESGGEKGHVRISFKCHHLLANNNCEIELSSYDFKDSSDPEYYSPEDLAKSMTMMRRRRKLIPESRGTKGGGSGARRIPRRGSEPGAGDDDPAGDIALREKEKFIETYSPEALKQAQISSRMQRCIVVWKRRDGSISPMTKKAFNREKVPFELTGVEGVASRKGYSEEDRARKAQSERRVRKNAMEETGLIESLKSNKHELKHLLKPNFTYLGYFREITFEYLYRIRYFLPANHLGFEVARLSYIFSPVYDHAVLLVFNAIFTITCFYTFLDYFDSDILMLIGSTFIVDAFVVALLLIDAKFNVHNERKQRATHRYCRLNRVDTRESVLLRLYYLLYDEKFFQGFQFLMLSYPILLLSLIGRRCALRHLKMLGTIVDNSEAVNKDNFDYESQLYNATEINTLVYVFVRLMDTAMLSNVLMHTTSFTTNILNLFFKLSVHFIVTISLNFRKRTGKEYAYMLPEQYLTYSMFALAFLLFCIPLTIFRQKAIRTEFFATYQSNKEMVKASEDKQKINRVIFDLYPLNIVPKLIAISNTDEKSMLIMEKALKGDFALHHENISPASVAFICLWAGDDTLAKWFRKYYPSQSASNTDSRQVGRQTAMEIVALNSILCAMDEELGRMQFIDKIKSYRDTYLAVSGLSMNPVTKQKSPKAPHIALMLYCLNLVHSKVPAFRQIEDQINTRARLTDKEAYDPSDPFRIRFKIGFCVGDLIAGTIGRDKPAFDCWGNTVNTSSRMYSNGAPDMIQCLVDTVEYLKEYFEFEPVGYKSIKGLGIQMTYAVKGLRLNKLRGLADNQYAE
ncbi:hypothetical protein BOX15_Mlig014029g3 [Macrostomum lignano]|uniref:adenylate cyclase n=2 Tax=Macrostomum lignano TaxID=282301 RepID=A0A267G583_9PLAT|nr:hypothetical protein BOX15_Mlig014029g3 [Macrostomum lignano]